MYERVVCAVKDLRRGDRLVDVGSEYPLPDSVNRCVEWVTDKPTAFFDNTLPRLGFVAVFLTSANPTRARWDVPSDLACFVDRWV